MRKEERERDTKKKVREEKEGIPRTRITRYSNPKYCKPLFSTHARVSAQWCWVSRRRALAAPQPLWLSSASYSIDCLSSLSLPFTPPTLSPSLSCSPKSLGLLPTRFRELTWFKKTHIWTLFYSGGWKGKNWEWSPTQQLIEGKFLILLLWKES